MGYMVIIDTSGGDIRFKRFDTLELARKYVKEHFESGNWYDIVKHIEQA